jgi:hypothetical protein
MRDPDPKLPPPDPDPEPPDDPPSPGPNPAEPGPDVVPQIDPEIPQPLFQTIFFSFSLGLVVTPSSQESTLPIVIVCSSSGALTRIVKPVPDPSGIPARTLRRNAAIASTAAS